MQVRRIKWSHQIHRKDCYCKACYRRKTGRIKPKQLDYFSYIKSPLWTQRKELYYKEHKKQCRACGTTHQIDLHHMQYGNFGLEPDYVLVPLCRTCHKEFHAQYAMKGNMVKMSLRYIANKQASIQALKSIL